MGGQPASIHRSEAHQSRTYLHHALKGRIISGPQDDPQDVFLRGGCDRLQRRADLLLIVHEDQVISVVAASLRARGIAVLAEGGNQMRAFRFLLCSGRRKAPDLVFALRQTLFVFEAKVTAADLFRPAEDGLSDFDVMTELSASAPMQAALLDEAGRRLASCGRGDESVLRIAPGLLAANSALDLFPKSHCLEVLCVNVSQRRWIVEASQWGDALVCQRA